MNDTTDGAPEMTDADVPDDAELANAPSGDISEASGGDISGDALYGLMGDKRRRYTIHYLKQRKGEEVGVGDVAERVAAWENDKPIDDITSHERKRVYIALYQSHLPTLAKEGVVEYDADRRVVSLSESMADREIYLEVVPRGNLPWSVFYVGLVLANSIVIVLSWLEISPFDRIPGIGLAVIVLVTFAATAAVQTLQSRRMRFGDEGPPPELH